MNLVEKIATCDSCYRSRRSCGSYRYEANLKCCTFYPFLPNYLVGAILSETSPSYNSGKEKIRAVIAKGDGVLPIGLVAPITYQLEFNRNQKTQFGVNEDWLCPYFEKNTNQCSVWRYRGTVCTSFYCKSSYGRSGKSFWKRLESYLSMLEMGLMEEALNYLDFSPREVSDQLAYLNVKSLKEFKDSGFPGLSEKWSQKDAARHWKHHFKDTEEFFKKCFKIVKQMGKKDLKLLLGNPGDSLLSDVYENFEQLK